MGDGISVGTGGSPHETSSVAAAIPDTTVRAAALGTCDPSRSVESSEMGSGEGRRSNGSGGGREDENADLKTEKKNITTATPLENIGCPLRTDGLVASHSFRRA